MHLNAGSLIKMLHIELPVKALTCLHIFFLRKNRLIQQKEFLSQNRWFSRCNFALKPLISRFRAATRDE